MGDPLELAIPVILRLEERPAVRLTRLQLDLFHAATVKTKGEGVGGSGGEAD